MVNRLVSVTILKETKNKFVSEDKDHHDHCSDICSHFSIFRIDQLIHSSRNQRRSVSNRQQTQVEAYPDQETRREEKRIKEEKRIYQDKRIY